MSEQRLFAFVDLKDPFMVSGIAEEERSGPILSLFEWRRFDSLVLFSTAGTRANIAATRNAVGERYPGCHIDCRELLIADPNDYSAVMGGLAREIREIWRRSGDAINYVCVSSGTAEMRAAWFLLTAAGLVRASLLQVGSPAEP